MVDTIPNKVYNNNIERRNKKINAKHWKGEKAQWVKGKRESLSTGKNC